jgi:hypothetical protein
VDGAGNAATSMDPGGGESAWTVKPIDPTFNDPNSFSFEPDLLQGVSCPVVSLCVAVDDAGNAISSTTPTDGPASWKLTHADDGIAYECYHYGETGPDCQPGFLGVACPSVSLCVGVDWSANILTTTEPTQAVAWSGASPNSASDQHLWGVACPSVDFCATVNGYGAQLMTWSPRRASAPGKSTSFGDTALFDVWCRSRSLCFMAGVSPTQHNVLFASTAPAGGRASWRITNNDPAGITSLACASDSVCVAGDSHGNFLIGRTAASVRHQLQRQLAASLRQVRLAVLRRTGGYRVRLTTQVAGRLRLSWYEPAITGNRRHAGRRSLVAVARLRFARPGTRTTELRLTRQGRRILATSTNQHLTASLALISTDSTAITAQMPFRIGS